MTRKNLAVGEMESEREPMLRGGKGKVLTREAGKKKKKLLISTEEKCHLLFSLLPAHHSIPPWFASYRPIFSDIFKWKVASLLLLKFSMSFIRNGVYIYNQFGPLPLTIWL